MLSVVFPRFLSQTLVSKMNQKLCKIGTHSGTFHADEVTACFMLSLLKPFQPFEITRSRDKDVLESMDILVDVGAVYDPKSKRFDHHQRGFEEVFSPRHKTKLSSAGLIYKHYGREVLSAILQLPIQHPNLDILYDKVYEEFVEYLDGNDNGIQQYVSCEPPRYKNNTSLASRISNLNPEWNETGVNVEERFHKAMQMAGEELISAVKYVNNTWLPARTLVESAFKNRLQTHSSGRIILLETCCPWKSHLFELEREQAVAEDSKPLYVIYEDDSKKWRIQAVPTSPDSFESRLALPSAWRGLRDQALDAVTGQKGGIFVHAGGFIGGHQTLEGALKLAELSLDMASESNKRKAVDIES